ncbi:hypothetical protein, partial [Lactobacillus crispatus]|uniref:hypothetical protein n=1 Tax=Lactobacillus crispatus TaxID=47770 RepID=UPI0010E13E7B
IDDPGRVGLEQDTAASGSGLGVTWFTLWTANTAINLFGGHDVAPLSNVQANYSTTETIPSILNVTAAGGSLYLTPSGANFMMPSPEGELSLFATASVIDAGGAFGPLTNSLSTIPTPFRPAWELLTVKGSSTSVAASNYWSDPNAYFATDGN